MGKSRLVSEAIASAHDPTMGLAGWLLRVGTRVPLCATHRDAVALSSPDADPAFSRFGRRSGSVSSHTNTQWWRARSSATNARYRLFRSLDDLLIALARKQPLLLILECPLVETAP